jgi:DNA-directed RNA polymerase specialized sigma24 family protein
MGRTKLSGGIESVRKNFSDPAYDLDDLRQDYQFRLLRHPKLRESPQARRAVYRSCTTDAARRAGRRAHAPLDERAAGRESDEPPFWQRLAEKEALARLKQCISELPRREQLAVRLRFSEDAPAARIAAEAGLNTRAAARTLVHRAVRRLQLLMAAS